jgi:uncharacterized protein
LARILLLLIIALLIWLVFRGFFRAQVKKGEAAPATSVAGESMVACARCGVHLPKSEARAEGNAFVCRDNPRCLPPR